MQIGSKSEMSESLESAGKAKTVSSFGSSCSENKYST